MYKTLMTGVATGLLAGVLMAGQGAWASDGDFQLQYRVERADTARLSLDQCARVAKTAADKAGYRAKVDHYPGQLAVIAGGPEQGGWSYVVYCIAVTDRTAHVTQSVAYQPEQTGAAEFVDLVHANLLKVGQ